jgi:hypothetical protein
MGWPILGDDIYGTAPRFSGPVLHLHAREVVVPISKNRPPVRVEAPVPAHMRERLMACGWNGEVQAAPEVVGRDVNERPSETALTKEFKDTVKERADRDPAFREALQKEGIDQPVADVKAVRVDNADR